MADEHVLDFAARGLQQVVDEPREHLGCEIKDWYDLSSDLNRAKVAKEIVALANYGGGHLIFGLSEQADGSYVASEREFDRAMYTQDCLNDLGKKYLDPGFECTGSRFLDT
jgi:predicted HTH transcriptional regulator